MELKELIMKEQEKTIAKIFDKSVEALGIMTKSLWVNDYFEQVGS